MADNSAIGWTNATWNIITGCSVVSPGCKRCYAMRLAGTRLAEHPSRKGLTVKTREGPVWTGEVRWNEAWLDQPLRWRRPRMIFVCAHGDLFHENVPDAWIDKVFAVMGLAHWHTFQVLTKRTRRMRDYMRDLRAPGRLAGVIEAMRDARGMRSAVGPLPHLAPGAIWWPLRNVWLGTSIEDQERADLRLPDLLETHAAVRWVSAEPLLGPVDLYRHITADLRVGRINWIVVGGESQRGARPMHPDWARSLLDQARGIGAAYFFKQWGSWGPSEPLQVDLAARQAYRGEIQTLQRPGMAEVKLCIPTRNDDILGPPLTLELGDHEPILDGRRYEEFPEARP